MFYTNMRSPARALKSEVPSERRPAVFETLKKWFRRDESHTWRSADESQMSPQERAFIEKTPEDRDADALIEGNLGGKDPDRLIE
jgi:hypothetical protein